MLLLASIVSFSILHLAPGDPVDILFGPSAVIDGQHISLARRQQLREELGLHHPLFVQYLRWLERMIRLDFGTSFRTRQPVAMEIGRRLPATLLLTILAFMIQVLLACMLGLLSAHWAHRWPDHVLRIIAIVFVAFPGFGLGLGLLYLFGVHLRWISIGSEVSVRQVLLPALTLGIGLAPQTMRVLRASLLTEWNRLYLTLGRAKGLSETTLLLRHALPNALLPTVTLLGLSFSGLLSGSVIIETVFSWPGIGKYVVDSIYVRDFPVIQGYVILITSMVLGVGLFVDLLYTLLDPRIRHGLGEV